MNQEKLLVILILGIIILGGVFAAYSKFYSQNSQTDSTGPTETVAFDPRLQSSSPSASITSSPTMNKFFPPEMKQYSSFPGVLSAQELQNKKAVIITIKGKIEFEIFSQSPKSASNFIFLTRKGFYDGLIFHRVEPGFVIQGGDPLGNGTGGPGYRFEDEPVTLPYTKGIVAYANSGPNTNGSQFFIMLGDYAGLPPKYNIFGKVISGQEVVDQIKKGDVMQKVTIENLR